MRGWGRGRGNSKQMECQKEQNNILKYSVDFPERKVGSAVKFSLKCDW